jgi:hypothetical protein
LELVFNLYSYRTRLPSNSKLQQNLNRRNVERDDFVNPAEVTDDPIQLANTLKAFAELRLSKAISDAEYDKLKARVLAALEQRVMPEPIVAPQKINALQPPQGLQEYAGDLHRLIAEKLAREYPSGEQTTPDERKRYLMQMTALLIEKSALYPSDTSHMTRVIETATDETYASSLERLVQGLTQLNAIRNEVRLSTDSSPLATAISSIASESAEKAVEAAATHPSSDSAKAEAQQTRRKRWWDAVLADVDGAFTGAAAVAAVLAVPGFPLAALAVLGPLGPAAAVVPVLGAVVGGGLRSGIERARIKQL